MAGPDMKPNYVRVGGVKVRLARHLSGDSGQNYDNNNVPEFQPN